MKYISTVLLPLAFMSASSSCLAEVAEITVDRATTLTAEFFEDPATGGFYSGDNSLGRLDKMLIYFESNFIGNGLIGFDLSAIYGPLDCGETITINSATLKIAETNGSAFIGGTDNQIRGAYFDDWNEDTVTWNNFYAETDSLILAEGTFEALPDQYLAPIDLEMTPANQEAFFDSGYLTLLIYAADFTFTDPIELHGADSSFEPILTVDYEITSSNLSNSKQCKREERRNRRQRKR